MRNLADSNPRYIPEQIMITDEEVARLISDAPDVKDAIKRAYFTGVQAMEEFNDNIQNEENERELEIVDDIANGIFKTLKVLRMVDSRFFDESPAQANSCVELICDNLARINDSLCRYFGIELI